MAFSIKKLNTRKFFPPSLLLLPVSPLPTQDRHRQFPSVLYLRESGQSEPVGDGRKPTPKVKDLSLARYLVWVCLGLFGVGLVWVWWVCPARDLAGNPREFGESRHRWPGYGVWLGPSGMGLVGLSGERFGRKPKQVWCVEALVVGVWVWVYGWDMSPDGSICLWICSLFLSRGFPTMSGAWRLSGSGLESESVVGVGICSLFLSPDLQPLSLAGISRETHLVFLNFTRV